MRRLPLLRLCSALFMLCYAFCSIAEGTREAAPNANIVIAGTNTTDIAALHIDSPIYNNFASYFNTDQNSRLHIHIKDPSTESIFIGFSWAHFNETAPNPQLLDFEYRIKDPNGNIVFGPIKVCANQFEPGVINNWLEGYSGPAQLGNPDGYDAIQASSLDAAGWTGPGDYYIEFFYNEFPGNGFLIDFWDLTVVKDVGGSLEEKKGRLWSYNWAIFAINDFGFPERPFNGAFHICSPDLSDPDAAYITQIDFNGSNFRPAAFNVAFNSFGSINTGNIIEDRKSLFDMNGTIPEFAIFLNDPIEICNTAEIGTLELAGISHCSLGNYCINFISTRPGQVNVLLDLDGPDGVYTPGSKDIFIVQNVDPSEVGIPVCIQWDGLDGQGNVVNSSSGVAITVSLSFNQGINHFPIYDAEFLVNGFQINAIRPTGPKPKLFYDDSSITFDSGTAEPKVNLAGCDLPCHTWNNFDYGNLNTINSWWFSRQSNLVTELVLPPIYTCSILGENQICPNQSTTLTIDIASDPSNIDLPSTSAISWSGPSIIGATIGEQIVINQPGIYSATILWSTNNNVEICQSTCEMEVTALPSETLLIEEEICFGESYIYNGEIYAASGTYTQTLPSSTSCDTIVTIDLLVQPAISETIFAEICHGDTITFNGQSYHSVGSYLQDLVAHNGCDSTLTIHLNVLPTYEICTPYSIITGEELMINGVTYTESGTYEQLLNASNGCDSLVIIKLDLLPPPAPDVLVHYDLDNCAAGPTYNEFTPDYPTDYPCASLDASTFNNNAGISHSCTPGVGHTSGMCISSQKSCTYYPSSPFHIAFDLNIEPLVGATVISTFSFYEKAPEMFEWSNSDTGINNYPTRYAIRILKDNVEIFSQSQLPTQQEWNQQHFDFTDHPDFRFSTAGTLRIELFPYCTVGNSSFVSAWDLDEIELSGYCTSATSIIGKVHTTEDKPMRDVAIRLSQGDQLITTQTDLNGNYAFDQIYAGADCYLQPYKNDDPLAGVNLQDLIKIQKHIFGIETMRNLDQLIAADIDKNGKISAIDLVLLRNLILGVTDAFSSNTSWRFFNQATTYSLLSDVEDQIVLQPYGQQIDLKGIKIGDVDRSLNPESDFQKVRSETDKFYLSTTFVERDRAYKIYAQEDAMIEGLQMQLSIKDLAWVEIIPQLLSITSDYYHYADDMLRICYLDQPTMIKKGDLLFEIKISDPTSIQLNASYENQIQAETIYDLVLEQDLEKATPEPTLSSLVLAPNPLVDDALLQFQSTTVAPLVLEITNVNGVQVMRRNIRSVKGHNNITLSREDFTHSGIYFITLGNGEEFLRKKVVVL